MTATQGIGRTLARIAALAPRRQPAEPGQDSRGHILELVRSADGPVSVEWLCERTDLHANTVRGHLEVLMAGGHVARDSEPATGRGRPRHLYRAESSPASLHAELVAALYEQLGDGTQTQLVNEAAEAWAAVVTDDGPAESIGDAVRRAAVALDALGFSPEVSSVGDTVTLATCPYADLIGEQPVICDIHTAMLGELLSRTGQPVAVSEMEVWAAPGICRARLSRPDLRPARRITPPTDAEESPTPRSGRKQK